MNSTPQTLKFKGPYTSPWANAMFELGWGYSLEFGWQKISKPGSKIWKEDRALADEGMEENARMEPR